MSHEQVTIWTQAALRRLDDLAGFILWEEDYPIPIIFCDGHAVHQGNLRELRQQFLRASEAARAGVNGEDGNPLDVSMQSVFLALYGMIFNAQYEQ